MGLIEAQHIKNRRISVDTLIVVPQARTFEHLFSSLESLPWMNSRVYACKKVELDGSLVPAIVAIVKNEHRQALRDLTSSLVRQGHQLAIHLKAKTQWIKQDKIPINYGYVFFHLAVNPQFRDRLVSEFIKIQGNLTHLEVVDTNFSTLFALDHGYLIVTMRFPNNVEYFAALNMDMLSRLEGVHKIQTFTQQ